MRLLILDQFSDPGGAQQVLLEWLPAIHRRGWKALVGMPGHGEMYDRVRGLGFETARIACGPYRSGRKSAGDFVRFLIGTPWLALQIRWLARRFRPGLIYVNGPRLLPGVALAGGLAPVLFHAHSFLFPGQSRRIAGDALRRSEALVIASCEFVAAPWRQYVGDRVSVIYNGVAGPATSRHVIAGPGSRPCIACIGRIAPEKGQAEFVRAASMIRKSLPDSRFRICGSALFSEPGDSRYSADLRSAAAGLPIEFTGWVKNVYQELDRVDLLLVPSAPHEGTTRVILEAFAAGVPVIAFRSGGIPEVVQDGRTGFLVDSTEAMARLAIELLSGDRERLASIAEAARQSWMLRYTLDRYHQELLGAVERLASSPKM
jgi:glycosyltransferase involved in cell wall biosynthesis